MPEMIKTHVKDSGIVRYDLVEGDESLCRIEIRREDEVDRATIEVDRKRLSVRVTPERATFSGHFSRPWRSAP